VEERNHTWVHVHNIVAGRLGDALILPSSFGVLRPQWQHKRPLRQTATTRPTVANPMRYPAARPRVLHSAYPPSLQHSPSVGYIFQGTPSAWAHKTVRGIYRAKKEMNRRKKNTHIIVASTPRKTTRGGSRCKSQQAVEAPTANPLGHPTRVHMHIPMAAMEESKGTDSNQVMTIVMVKSDYIHFKEKYVPKYRGSHPKY
jgi:hypothetical protein